jgi:hypothetical protein
MTTGTNYGPCSITIHRTFAQDALMTRVRGEYREMPGMRLTVDQAMRLWTLDRDTCSRVLSSLVAAHFLERDRDGRFMRAHGGY